MRATGRPSEENAGAGRVLGLAHDDTPVSPDVGGFASVVVEPQEGLLVEALQPIRHFALASSLYHLFELGLFESLLENGACSLASLADRHHLDKERLETLLDYLANEGIVASLHGMVSLTAKGQNLREFRPWYTLFIGGYGRTFLEIGEKLRLGSGRASRDGAKVGIGSCGISRYDAIPLTRRLMAKIPGGCRRLLDLGCGNGLYLVEFCKAFPDLEAWGIEPDPGSYRSAQELVSANHMEHRVRLECISAAEFRPSSPDGAPDLCVLGFVLHEILGQEGRDGAIRFLRRMIDWFPEIYVIVIEVNQRMKSPTAMRHMLSLAYYNPYYLLHPFTGQRLETTAFWEGLFHDCGLEILAEDSVASDVDSTGLEVGYLLHRRG